MSREHPILFNGDMVRAILSGAKTQTRRPVRSENSPNAGHTWRRCLCREIDPADTPCDVCRVRYNGRPADAGDQLWVRETFGRDSTGAVYYRADSEKGGAPSLGIERWFPSIHMHRHSSRIMLEVTAVRTERLQSIRPEDARCEGVHFEPRNSNVTVLSRFRRLWDSAYGRSHDKSWDDNPRVWVVTFQIAKDSLAGASLDEGETNG